LQRHADTGHVHPLVQDAHDPYGIVEHSIIDVVQAAAPLAQTGRDMRLIAAGKRHYGDLVERVGDRIQISSSLQSAPMRVGIIADVT
jgi:hypothetical protein